MSKHAKQTIDSTEALHTIAILEKQAKKTCSESVKKILLCAGCSIADLAIAQNSPSREAA